jgi:hypothetical protein
MKVFKRGVELLFSFQISIAQTETKRAPGDADRAVSTLDCDKKGITNVDDWLYGVTPKAAPHRPSTFNLNWYFINVPQFKIWLQSC